MSSEPGAGASPVVLRAMVRSPTSLEGKGEPSGHFRQKLTSFYPGGHRLRGVRWHTQAEVAPCQESSLNILLKVIF